MLPMTNHARTIFRKQDYRGIVVKIISLLEKPDNNLLSDQCLIKYPMLRWLIVPHLTQSKRQTCIMPFKTCLFTSQPSSKQWSQNFINLCKNWWKVLHRPCWWLLRNYKQKKTAKPPLRVSKEVLEKCAKKLKFPESINFSVPSSMHMSTPMEVQIPLLDTTPKGTLLSPPNSSFK